MIRRFASRFRLVAAFLAAFGLAAAPLRAFAPCEMQARATAAGQQAHGAVEAHGSSGHHGHMAPEQSSGHDAHALHHAPPPAESPSEDAPHSEPCLDLTHCAVMAWTPLATRIPPVVVHVERQIAEPDARLRSIGRAIDTPPPKRA